MLSDLGKAYSQFGPKPDSAFVLVQRFAVEDTEDLKTLAAISKRSSSRLVAGPKLL
jgi:hypothetical protein